MIPSPSASAPYPTTPDPTTPDHAVAGSAGHADEPLTKRYDVALLDLDGVVYVGPDAVPGVPRALETARADGMRLAFVTNNAARTPEAVATHLTQLGVTARAEEVTTSAQAAAHYLADRLDPGAAVLVVGTTGLLEALRERGLRPVESADDGPAAVVQGYSPELGWKQLAEGAVAIRHGALWVATNLDPTVPSPRGPLPGNGSLVAALRHATGVTPVATGKPDPTMHRESVERSGARRPIVVGDRLDTDIEGARAVGCASMLVLSGVTSPAELLAAIPDHRPDFLSATAAGLLRAHSRSLVGGGGGAAGVDSAEPAEFGGFAATVSGPGVLRLSGTSVVGGPAEGEDSIGLDALRALCVAAWRADPSGQRTQWRVQTNGDAADDAAAQLDLTG